MYEHLSHCFCLPLSCPCHPLFVSPSALYHVIVSCFYCVRAILARRSTPPHLSSHRRFSFGIPVGCTGLVLVVGVPWRAEVLAFLNLTFSRALASSWSGTDRLDEPLASRTLCHVSGHALPSLSEPAQLSRASSQPRLFPDLFL